MRLIAWTAGLLMLLVIVTVASDGCDTSAGSSPPSAPAPEPAPVQLEWYQGGTLHQKTAVVWVKATYRNRLATAADYATVR